MPRRHPTTCHTCGEDLLLDPDTNSLACPNCSCIDGDTFAEKFHAARLLVPARAEADGIIGDGVQAIGPDHPDYPAWLQWHRRHGA